MIEVLYEIAGFLLMLVTTSPPGFAHTDDYSDADEACAALVPRYVHPGALDGPVVRRERKAALAYCRYRTHHSSRGNRIHSRVDGSWIHDRDRPAAWAMWRRRVRHGRLRPDVCPWHRMDRSRKRPKASKALAYDWPFSKPVMTPERRATWLRLPYDVERFGTRGPHDHNLGAAQRWLPGCYPTDALDRYDVSVGLTVMHAAEICEQYGCKTWRDIRAHWRG